MPKKKSTLIKRIAREASAAAPVSRRGHMASFIKAYFARVPVDDLAARRVPDLAGAALCHLNLAGKWMRTPRFMRVYNPDRERDGWSSEHTVVDIVTHDSPFLVDSVTMEINRQGFVNHLIVHPLLRLVRAQRGRIVEVRAADGDADESELISFIHAEIDNETDPERLLELETGLNNALDDVRASVRDWKRIAARVKAAIAEMEIMPLPLNRRLVEESAAFLRWLTADHFTFLGYRDYDLVRGRGGDSLRVVPGTGLGVLRERRGLTRSAAFDKLPPQLKRHAREKTLLTLTKSNSRSTVHRAAYLDYIGIKRYGPGGRVTGERRVLGLYTSTAYLGSPGSIPLVRKKIDSTMNRSGLMPNSHAGKLLLNVLETYPRDELLQADEDDLFATAMGIVDLQERQRVRLFIRRDHFERFCACLVFVPRERFHSGIRRRIQEILLRALNGTGVDFETSISQSVYARLYMTVHTTPGKIPAYDAARIESEIAAATRTWTDDLQVELIRVYGENWGNDLLHRYRDAFPVAYQEEHSTNDAAGDVRRIEAALAAGELQLVLYQDPGVPADHVRFRLYNPDASVHLSAALPILENMGLFVISQTPFEVGFAGGRRVWLHDFGMRHRRGRAVDPAAIRERFQEAFAGIWSGTLENDSFNQLVLGAGLSAREITLLRAYSKYMRQIGSAFSQSYIEDTLNRHGEIAGLLVELFRARFDPDAGNSRKQRIARLEKRIESLLDAVPSLDEDRILRRFYDLIRATLRTNYFQTQAGGLSKGHLSIKLASKQIPELEPPHPLYEIFVYSPRVEGVHLRGGKVARGGLRWSDRKEDFRTEVLGLMKAQTVKNAVIVPVGAKGGFFVKNPPAGDRAAVLAEGVECYKTFVRGLLDLTDNRRGGKIIPPACVVRYDDDDPYLVVAADKGTATFSDIANSVSAEYGFWLEDAFASGGSAGYDHKAMAITARGAWESVRHHFQKIGIDAQTTDFSVVGIGDMSGDVFGNGLLLSRHIRLLGAFNHLHIFLDPDPDPGKSFEERTRLFNLPGSTWADYRPELISAGGGVFPRSAKSIRLSPEVKRMLDTNLDSMSPNEVIRLLLMARVDLLWNGGIGTYIKADDELHSAAGDRSNDGVRVNSSQLRCKVIGEGGNLGLTQRGRVRYAQAGGLLNADWIDNSGGVHCSDREVNIKILLNGVVAGGKLTLADRNRLLRRMTGDVTQLVLQDNYRQARAITAAEFESRTRPGWYGELLCELDRVEDFSREREQLPDAAALDSRRLQQQGLARPEIAAILAHTKMALYRNILGSDLPDEPYLQGMLERYFPKALQDRYREAIHHHQLHREIVATMVTNSMVNRAGIPFAHRLADETGAAIAEITRAFLMARDIFDVRRLWTEIDRLDFKVSLDGQMQLVFESQHLLRHAARWLLRHGHYLRDVTGTVERFRTGVDALGAMVERLPGMEDWEFLKKLVDSMRERGIPSLTAKRFAGLRMIIFALEVTRLAEGSGGSFDTAAQIFFLLGKRLRLQIAHTFANTLTTDTAWQDRARTDLAQELLSLQGDLTANALSAARIGQRPEAVVENWLGQRQEALRRYEEVLEDLRRTERVELAMLNVMTAKLRNLKNSAGV